MMAIKQKRSTPLWVRIFFTLAKTFGFRASVSLDQPDFTVLITLYKIRRELIAYVTNLVRWLLWTTTAIVATIITGSILLEFVGYYGAFNWLINTIYGASTIIMKVVGWN